jgi:hypothetical protein
MSVATNMGGDRAANEAQQDIERAALERTETRPSRGAGPDGFECFARAIGAAVGIAVRERRRIHGSHRSAGNAVDA